MTDVSKVLRAVDIGVGRRGFAFWCQPCGATHRVATDGQSAWSFNGDVNTPTFSPSIKVTQPKGDFTRICHCWVTDGLIRYEPDSTHELAGQTVEMSPILLAGAES